jgi:hypothetical protein
MSIGKTSKTGKKAAIPKDAPLLQKRKRRDVKGRRAVSGSRPDTLELVPTPRGGTMLALRSHLAMNRETFARLLPVSTRSLADIEQGSPPNSAVFRRLTELDRIVQSLREVVKDDALGAWMGRPNQAFDGLKPIEVIERGEVDRIWRMVFLLRSGMPF